MTESVSILRTPSSLVLRIRDPKDADAWNRFYALYAPLVYQFFRGTGIQAADAEEISQEVFFRVMKAIQSFEYRPELGRFRNWLGQIARNEIRRFLSKKNRFPQTPDGTDPADIQARAENAWDEHLVRYFVQTALQRIRPHFEEHTWLIFEKVWLQNCPAAAVAEELGIRTAQVYVAKSRVLGRLKPLSNNWLTKVMCRNYPAQRLTQVVST